MSVQITYRPLYVEVGGRGERAMWRQRKTEAGRHGNREGDGVTVGNGGREIDKEIQQC